jgi:HK97 gp10 family phage protein
VRIGGFDDTADEFAEFAEGLRDVADNLDEAIDEGVKTTAFQIEGTAKRRAPVDTGALRAGIEARRLTIAEWVVGAKTEYATAVEFGTAPHVIEADQADALAFTGQDGELVFRQRVEHPGTPAQPFLRPALAEHQSDLVENINAEIEKLFDRYL